MEEIKADVKDFFCKAKELRGQLTGVIPSAASPQESVDVVDD